MGAIGENGNENQNRALVMFDLPAESGKCNSVGNGIGWRLPSRRNVSLARASAAMRFVRLEWKSEKRPSVRRNRGLMNRLTVAKSHRIISHNGSQSIARSSDWGIWAA